MEESRILIEFFRKRLYVLAHLGLRKIFGLRTRRIAPFFLHSIAVKISPNRTLKLYRGLSAEEFQLASKDLAKRNKATWSAILEKRARGDFRYPAELDQAILALHRDLRLEYQYFTDTKSIAEGYARKVRGLLVELSVPVADLLAHFDVEFQNFGQRKKRFEIVYAVRGATLARLGAKWKLKVSRKK